MSWGQHTLDAKKEDLSSLAIFGGQPWRWWFVDFLGEIVAWLYMPVTFKTERGSEWTDGLVKTQITSMPEFLIQKVKYK